MIDHLFDELSKNKVELSDSISIDLSDLIKKENFEDKMNSIFTKEFSTKLITDCLGQECQFDGESNGYFLWSM